MTLLDEYKLVEPTIRKLYDSSLRIAILDALSKSPMRLADLRREVNSSAPNTSAKAKELEGMGLVEKIEGDYKLTAYGRAVRTKLQDSFDFYTTYKKFKDFWESRDISAIPESLWLRLGELKSCEFVKAEAPEVMKTHEECLTIIQSPKKEFYGITPLFRPVYLQIAFSLLKSGIHAEFMLSDKVLAKVVEASTPEIAQMFDNYKNQVLFLNNNIPLTLKVSERWFFMALDSKTSKADMMSMDIQSMDQEAIKWGKDLYDFYKKDAEPVRLKDYL